VAGTAIVSSVPSALCGAESPKVPPGIAPARADFEFALPPGLIAQHPSARREDARLLVVGPHQLVDAHIPDLLAQWRAGDLVVLNDTRVIRARLHGEKDSGGRVEALIERVVSDRRALALVRTSHAPRPGLKLRFHAGTPGAPRFAATVVGRHDDLFELEFAQDLDTVLATAGQVPLPPYITHAPDPRDAERYQTVYARHPGAVAAPTAGLHLSESLLGQLAAQGVETAAITLHVGAGTFQPVRSANLAEHRMHAERYTIPADTAQRVNAALAQGRRVIAVGTTSVRALESAMHEGRLRAGDGETRLFILPGHRFQCVQCMLTNFHLPGSTLLMLVSAFAGTARIRAAYAHAIARRYRFFSYGDAMLLERAPEAA